MVRLLVVLIAACSARAHPAKTVECGADIAGLDPILARERVVAIAEVHGTREIPRIAGDIVCRAARSREVVLVIEHDAREQPAIDRTLASGDPAPLLAGAMWTNAGQDGRSSRAMLELVLRMRGLHVPVTAMDAPNDQPGADRDAHMAGVLARVTSAHPRALVVVLTGLSHAWKTRGAPWNPAQESALYRLGQQVPAYAIAIRQTDGEFWGCYPKSGFSGPIECGPHREGDPARRVASVTLARFQPTSIAPLPKGARLADDAFDAELDLGALTPSPPAVP